MIPENGWGFLLTGSSGWEPPPKKENTMESMPEYTDEQRMSHLANILDGEKWEDTPFNVTPEGEKYITESTFREAVDISIYFNTFEGQMLLRHEGGETFLRPAEDQDAKV